MSISNPFDAEAGGYDETFTDTLIGRSVRARFWRYADPLLLSGMRMLDLGGGTGEDACHFASRGMHVVLTDSSTAMLGVAQQKIAARGLESKVQICEADLERLGAGPSGWLEAAELFDGAYSNFGAVNCVEDLPGFAAGLSTLLKPGAPLLLSVMGPCVPWEWWWFLKRGQVRKAFRRLSAGGVAWRGLRVQYPKATRLARAFDGQFELRGVRALNAFVPPTYLAEVMARRPSLVARLSHWDERWANSRLLVALSDHYLAHFVRR